MKAKDLRQDNLITLSTDKYKIYKVLRVTNNLVTIDLTHDNWYDERSFNIKDIRPVKITDELLNKLGFIKEDKGYGDFFSLPLSHYIATLKYNCFIDEYELRISVKDNTVILTTVVTYFHKLQNIIYDVVDLELDIDNIIKSLNK